MKSRPRTKFTRQTMSRRCAKCKAKLNNQKTRCKRCSALAAKPRK